MKFLKLILIAIIAHSITFTSLSVQAERNLDSIVAVVNDDIITRRELQNETRDIVERLSQSGQKLPAMELIEAQVLEKIIIRKLQLEAAKQAGIQVSNEMLAQAISNIAKRNKLTIGQFRQALKQQGMSYNAYRKQLESQIILQRLRNTQIVNKLKISEQEIDNFLAHNQLPDGRTAYHLNHILIAVREGADAETIGGAKQKALDIIQQLKSGASFRNIALTESDGRQALKGGDLGWLEANKLPSIFTEVVSHMQKGEISKPLRSGSGFHIIKLVDFKGSNQKMVNQTHVRHILIRTNELTSEDEAKNRLLQLRSRIVQGDDFSVLARSNSDDKGSAVKGGDLGWITPNDVVPRFAEEMTSLDIDQISQPFLTDFGWHILQVIGRRSQDNTEQQRRDQAREILMDRKAEEETELFSRRLRDEAYIEKRLNNDF